jgi:ketosteroid isomerase-like protein
MGQARELMDQISQAVMADDVQALYALYATDAVAETPDEGRLEGSEAIVAWLRQFGQAFSDISFEMISTTESGDTAIDEAYMRATHTGPIPGPEGEIAPTGKAIRLRECDVVTVAGGKVVSHRFYYDQLEFLGQLGALEPAAIVLPDARSSTEPTAATAR